MKKLILILFFVLIFSCKKEERFCWMCYSIDSKTQATINSASYCNMTPEEIQSVNKPEIIVGVTYRKCYNVKWIKRK
jgi:hypothetical protein